MQTKEMGVIILRVLCWYFLSVGLLNIAAYPMGQDAGTFLMFAIILLSTGFAVFCLVKASQEPGERMGFAIAVLVFLVGFPTCFANLRVLPALFSWT